MGRATTSAFTLDKCQRLSSSTRCFTATWAAGCRCCILQPPQAPACRPKCGQPGVTRCGLLRAMAETWPCSQLFFLRETFTRTRSPGRAPSMNTTLPCRRGGAAKPPSPVGAAAGSAGASRAAKAAASAASRASSAARSSGDKGRWAMPWASRSSASTSSQSNPELMAQDYPHPAGQPGLRYPRKSPVQRQNRAEVSALQPGRHPATYLV